MTLENTTAWLKDQAEIERTILCYATAADTRDWSLHRSILADRLDIDFASMGGPALNLSAEEYVTQVQGLIPGFDATQHQLTNFKIDITENHPETTVYMQAEHFYRTETEVLDRAVGGYYCHKLERVQGA
ncbi:MAG: nuclear transport factor 2 family protein [Eubacteriales bacterium]